MTKRRWIGAFLGVVVLALCSTAGAQSTTTSTSSSTSTTTSTSSSTTTSTSTSTTTTTTSSTTTSTLILHAGSGVLALNQTVNGLNGRMLCLPRAGRVLNVETTISGTATVTIEQQYSSGGEYFTVTGSSKAASGQFSQATPSGCYQSRVAGCSGCTVRVQYSWAY